MMKKLLFCATIAGSLALTSIAQARSAYDGSWDLVFVTQRGACDPTYNSRQHHRRRCHASKPRQVQRLRRSVGGSSRFGDCSGQICLGVGKAVWRFRPRNLVWLFRKRALLRLLDRAAKLASALDTTDEA